MVPPNWQLQPPDPNWKGKRFLSPDDTSWLAVYSFPAATDASERSLRIVAHQRVSLIGIRRGEEVPCDTLEACLAVSRYLLDQAAGWLD